MKKKKKFACRNLVNSPQNRLRLLVMSISHREGLWPKVGVRARFVVPQCSAQPGQGFNEKFRESNLPPHGFELGSPNIRY